MTPGCSSELEVVALLFRMSLHSNLAIRLDQFHDAQRTKLTGAERTARKRRRRGVRVEREVRHDLVKKVSKKVWLFPLGDDLLPRGHRAKVTSPKLSAKIKVLQDRHRLAFLKQFLCQE